MVDIVNSRGYSLIVHRSPRRVARYSVLGTRSVPANRRFVQIDVDLLGLEIFFDPPWAKFAAKARLLKTSPRRLNVRRLHVIHPHDSSADSLNRAHGFVDIARPDSGSEAIRRIVGNLYRVFFVVEGNDGGDRAKDFFAGNAGAVVDVVENRRLHIIAFGYFFGASATGGQLGFLLADFYVLIDAIVLFFADQRPHLRFAFQRRPKLDFFRLLGHRFNEIPVDGFFNKDAAAGRANFTLIDEYAEERTINRGFEIGIGKKDIRRFATKFESDALYGVRSLFHDDFAHGGTAGKSNFIDVGMLNQWRAAGFSEAGNDVHNPRRQSAIGEVFGEFERGQRRLLGRFQNAGASRSQGGCELPCRHEQRIVPRNNLSGDAKGFFQR